MNEVEKMRSSQLADMSVPEIQVKFKHAKRLLAKMRVMSTYDEDYRSLLEELVPGGRERRVPVRGCGKRCGTAKRKHLKTYVSRCFSLVRMKGFEPTLF